MDYRNWRSTSRNKNTIFLGKSFSEHPYGRFSAQPEDPIHSAKLTMQKIWKQLRRKFSKEKKAFGSGKYSNPVIVPYNSYTYSQNFDDKNGLAITTEPENLSRSFSARFARSKSSRPMFMSRVQSVR